MQTDIGGRGKPSLNSLWSHLVSHDFTLAHLDSLAGAGSLAAITELLLGSLGLLGRRSGPCSRTRSTLGEVVASSPPEMPDRFC